MTDEDLSEAALRKLLRPRRRPPQPVVKGRRWVMSERDIAAFVRILCERFPMIVFLKGKSAGERQTKWDLVPDPVGVHEKVYAVVPDGDWDAAEYCAQPRQPWGSSPEKSFSFWIPNGPFIHRLDSGRVIESLGQGTLGGGHAKSDRDTARFLAQVWRITAKVSTNKVEIKEIDETTGRTVGSRRIPLLWYGFDALHWCLERDNRVLDWCDRPPDDWEMPDSPYYD